MQEHLAGFIYIFASHQIFWPKRMAKSLESTLYYTIPIWEVSSFFIEITKTREKNKNKKLVSFKGWFPCLTEFSSDGKDILCINSFFQNIRNNPLFLLFFFFSKIWFKSTNIKISDCKKSLQFLFYKHFKNNSSPLPPPPSPILYKRLYHRFLTM